MTAHDRRALTDQIEATRERAKHTLENYHHDGRAGLGARDVLALASTVEQLAVELDRLRKAEGRECECMGARITDLGRQLNEKADEIAHLKFALTLAHEQQALAVKRADLLQVTCQLCGGPRDYGELKGPQHGL